MEIIRYFCIVKRFSRLLTTLCLVVFLSLTAGAHANNVVSQQQDWDRVEISLLTCSPGTEVWSLYGHTAIRVQDRRAQEDLVVNYGIFNFNQDYFILRFVFGLTDYEMGIVPYQIFLQDYASQGRSIVQQRLHLMPEEKASIVQALTENYRPENRVYRYNYFYDNCTTRARDMLVNHLVGKVKYDVDTKATSSYREMIHQWTEQHRWARFGNDLLLGVGADQDIDFAQQQFLPNNLQTDFGYARVVQPNGSSYALVDSTSEILRANPANAKLQESLWDHLSPRLLFFLVALLVLFVTAFEFIRRKTFWILDVALLVLDGLAGFILLAMIFSQHPTVSFNLQMLLLNPLSLCFMYPVAKQAQRGGCHWYWNVLGICILLFFIGGFFQHYAEGMTILGSVLLIRVLANVFIYKQLTATK